MAKLFSAAIYFAMVGHKILIHISHEKRCMYIQVMKQSENKRSTVNMFKQNRQLL